MLAAIAHWALQGGSASLHLGVLEANVAARRLYSGLGFEETHHAYWYRTVRRAPD